MKLNQQDRMISVRVPQEVYDKLDFLAEQHWCDISSVIRSGIRRELSANQELLEDESARQSHHNRAY